MAMTSFKPIAPRPAPIKTEGCVPWIRRNLFGDWRSILTTVHHHRAGWPVYLPRHRQLGRRCRRSSSPTADACQAARGIGACWGVVTEKYRIIIFGRYPYDEQWRPAARHRRCCSALLVASCIRVFWKTWLAGCGSSCSASSSC